MVHTYTLPLPYDACLSTSFSPSMRSSLSGRCETVRDPAPPPAGPTGAETQGARRHLGLRGPRHSSRVRSSRTRFRVRVILAFFHALLMPMAVAVVLQSGVGDGGFGWGWSWACWRSTLVGYFILLYFFNIVEDIDGSLHCGQRGRQGNRLNIHAGSWSSKVRWMLGLEGVCTPWCVCKRTHSPEEKHTQHTLCLEVCVYPRILHESPLVNMIAGEGLAKRDLSFFSHTFPRLHP